MKCSRYQCKENIQKIAHTIGFYACGMTHAREVEQNVTEYFSKWTESGKNANMEYLNNYPEIRKDPRLLIEGAKTVIVLAMSYYHEVKEGENLSKFALYAHGDDYHEVLREKVRPITEYISQEGGECRICVDSAPILEKYWAVQSGIGYIGKNSLLIIPDAGSYFFLCEIITTLDLPADEPLKTDCGDCTKCITCCPGKAIENGHLDARKCRSYLTIEHRGDLPENLHLSSVYGCDICQRVCPQNAHPPVTPMSEFLLRKEISSLTPEKIEKMSQSEFSAIFRHSPVKRAKLAGLKRNAANLKRNEKQSDRE